MHSHKITSLIPRIEEKKKLKRKLRALWVAGDRVAFNKLLREL